MVVAVLVRTAPLGRVSLLAVKFHDQPVVLVVPVTEAPGAARFPEPELLARRRQAVGARHVPLVAVLKATIAMSSG